MQKRFERNAVKKHGKKVEKLYCFYRGVTEKS